MRVALVGGGIGGLTAAVALSHFGFEAHVFEQAGKLREVGAGVGIGPNAVKVLRALGVENALKARGFEAEQIEGRNWFTAETLFRVPMKGDSETRYGAGHFQIHRADLLEILADALSGSPIHLQSRCVSVSSTERAATIALSDGRQEEFDLVVGCDGLHSAVRAALGGPDVPRFTGNMCWRALIRTAKLPPRHVLPQMTVWLGPGGHIATYLMRGGDIVNLVAYLETPDWVEESWSMESSTSELVAGYPGVHANLRTVLESAENCFKWGLFDRDPLPRWSRDRVTLLGDAAHPMLPFLGRVGRASWSRPLFWPAPRPFPALYYIGVAAQANQLHLSPSFPVFGAGKK